ncbi:hypothetical protein BW730_09095 [Tessaracoccus aquimaris]|uniref:Uncharacterized protein n=1 Tax=Tessaracoccus aquimaris TaxID=1332264 RepID=A0A1Q2CNE1_9ACTN|nr:hypothetical protein [Tessaracoccus aquimaris]AQP47627.1 hypothetical protein BW730_09095 [Tessaracoccus aquimaris]
MHPLVPQQVGTWSEQQKTEVVPSGATLRDWSRAFAGLDPALAAEVPYYEFDPKTLEPTRAMDFLPGVTKLEVLGWFVAGLVALWAAVNQPWLPPIGYLPALLLGALVGFGVSFGVRWLIGNHESASETDPMTVPRIVERIEELPPAAEPQPPLDPPGDAVARVKEAYGALLLDVVYRIESPALFDGAEPTTRRFVIALATWDDTPQDERTAAQSAEVAAAFESARVNAEHLGLNHLPIDKRETGRRLLSATRIATDDDSPAGERDAARRRVVDLIDALALYYLPRVDAAAPGLIGAPRQVEAT